jgi:hypothetical protein
MFVPKHNKQDFYRQPWRASYVLFLRDDQGFAQKFGVMQMVGNVRLITRANVGSLYLIRERQQPCYGVDEAGT